MVIATEGDPAVFEFVGGAVCLDLVNTGSRRSAGPFRERLVDYERLLEWAELAGAIEPEEAVALRRRARAEPARAAEVLERARELREAVYRTFCACCQSDAPRAADLATISRAYADASAHRALKTGADRIDFEWTSADSLDRPLWPVALSAAELLVSDQRARVKECVSDNCNWLFLDVSKNKSRRWCEMRDCGNRAKARRHYHKTKQS